MSHFTVIAIGGLVCGFAAGAAAQYGRLCTFAAIEDALMGRDFRRTRAWVLAIAVAIGTTHLLVAAGLVDLSDSSYRVATLAAGGVLVGAVLFGIGMALIGTCAFGLLVRAGSGDLRALTMVCLVGVTAFAATGGFLAPLRTVLGELMLIDLKSVGGANLTGMALAAGGLDLAAAVVIFVTGIAGIFALSCKRIRRKPRLMAASVVLGLAVTGGWVVTDTLADPFETTRAESLTFVAPVGRALLAIMGQTFSGVTFGVMTVVGVLAGSFAIAFARRELRWEAFDDQREMRRHIVGAALMGFGGVLAQGCTIGQGVSAASTLALSAPIAIFGMVVGAKLGLMWLLDGRALIHVWLGWIGVSRRARSLADGT